MMRLLQYSQITMSYDLKRQGTRLFVNLFLGFLLAAMLSALVIAVNCSKPLYGAIGMSDLIAISIGALFTLLNTLLARK